MEINNDVEIHFYQKFESVRGKMCKSIWFDILSHFKRLVEILYN